MCFVGVLGNFFLLVLVELMGGSLFLLSFLVGVIGILRVIVNDISIRMC